MVTLTTAVQQDHDGSTESRHWSGQPCFHCETDYGMVRWKEPQSALSDCAA